MPRLAESWEESADALRVQLRLRPGARWHDGRPVTAVDVQASFEPLMRASSRQPTLRAMLADVEAVEMLPDRMVRLRLRRPSRLVMRALCEVPILTTAKDPVCYTYQGQPDDWRNGKRFHVKSAVDAMMQTLGATAITPESPSI